MRRDSDDDFIFSTDLQPAVQRLQDLFFQNNYDDHNLSADFGGPQWGISYFPQVQAPTIEIPHDEQEGVELNSSLSLPNHSLYGKEEVLGSRQAVKQLQKLQVQHQQWQVQVKALKNQLLQKHQLLQLQRNQTRRVSTICKQLQEKMRSFQMEKEKIVLQKQQLILDIESLERSNKEKDKVFFQLNADYKLQMEQNSKLNQEKEQLTRLLLQTQRNKEIHDIGINPFKPQKQDGRAFDEEIKRISIKYESTIERLNEQLKDLRSKKKCLHCDKLNNQMLVLKYEINDLLGVQPQDFRSQILALLQDRKKSSEVIKNLKMKLQEQRTGNATDSEELASLRRQVDEKEQQAQTRIQQIDRQNRLIEHLKQENQEIKAQINSISLQFEQIARVKSNLQNQLSQSKQSSIKEEFVKVQTLLSEREAQLAKQKQTRRQLSQKVSTVEKQLKTKQGQLQQKLSQFQQNSKELNQHKLKQNQLCQKINSLERIANQAKKLQDQVQQKNAKLIQSAKEMKETQKLMAQIKAENSILLKESQRSKKELSQFKKELVDSKKELMESKKENSEMKKQLSEIRKQQSESRKQISKLKSVEQCALKQRREKQKSSSQKSQQTKKEGELQRRENEIKRRQTQYKKTISIYNEQILKMKQNYEKSLNKLQNDLNLIKTKNLQQKDELTRVLKENKKLNQQHSLLENASANQLRLEIQELNSRVQQLQDQIRQQSAQNLQLRSQNSRWISQVKKFKKEMQYSSQQRVNQTERFKTLLQETELGKCSAAQLQSCKESLRALQRANNQLQEEVQQLREQIRQLQRERCGNEREMQKKNIGLQIMKEKIVKIEKEKLDLESQIKLKTFTESRTQLEALQLRLQEASRQINKLTLRNKELESQALPASSELHILKNKVRELSAALSRCTLQQQLNPQSLSKQQTLNLLINLLRRVSRSVQMSKRLNKSEQFQQVVRRVERVTLFSTTSSVGH